MIDFSCRTYSAMVDYKYDEQHLYLLQVNLKTLHWVNFTFVI